MLQINKSIFDFHKCGYRGRSHRAQCLVKKISRLAASDLQTAVCCYIGLGVTRPNIALCPNCDTPPARRLGDTADYFPLESYGYILSGSCDL